MSKITSERPKDSFLNAFFFLHRATAAQQPVLEPQYWSYMCFIYSLIINIHSRLTRGENKLQQNR